MIREPAQAQADDVFIVYPGKRDCGATEEFSVQEVEATAS